MDSSYEAIANFDLSLSDIDFAVEPIRVRHSFKSMIYIDYYAYELAQITNKVIDDSIYNNEPLTKSYLIKKLMNERKKNKEGDEVRSENTIISIISD